MLVARRKTITRSLGSPVRPKGRDLKHASAALQFLKRATSLPFGLRLAAARFRSRRGRKQLIEAPLAVIVGAVLLGLVVYLITNTKLTTASFVGLSLVFSGGLSNFYDRASNNGAVIDFLNIGIGTIRTGIFNVADMVIMAGLTVLIVSQYLFNGRDSM